MLIEVPRDVIISLIEEVVAVELLVLEVPDIQPGISGCNQDFEESERPKSERRISVGL